VPTAYLGLGSNEGDRLAHLQAAVKRLAERAGRVTAVSAVYETAAHTLDSAGPQPAFLNAVVRLETDRSPEALLRIAQSLERAAGRPGVEERERWSPRPLDVDLLVVGPATRSTETLRLPHPRLGERRFVLRPWADLAPNLEVPPPFESTVATLLERCTDDGAIRRTSHSLPAPSSNDSARST